MARIMGFFGSTWRRLQGKKEGSLRKEWAFDSRSQMLARPLSFRREGKLFVAFGTASGAFFLLGEQARELWSYSVKDARVDGIFLENGGIFSTPALFYPEGSRDPCLLFGCDDRSLYSIGFDGKLRWRFRADGAVRTTPLIADIDGDGKEEIVFGSRAGTLFVLGPDGLSKASFHAGSGIDSSPIFAKDRNRALIVFGSDSGEIFALTKDLEKVWSFKTEGKVIAQPVAADVEGDGRTSIIIGSFDGNLYALGLDGTKHWAFETEGGIASKATVSDVNSDGKKEILFGSSDDKVYCLSSCGNKIWDFEADFWVVDTPHAVDLDNDGKLEIVVGSLDSTIYVLDGEGSFSLNYMPGIAAVTNQSGHYLETASQEVGDFASRMLWQAKTEGMVIGAEADGGSVIVGTKNGFIEKFTYAR